MHFRRIAFTLAFAGFAGAALAEDQPIGIAACDSFINNYEACVSTKVPEAQRAMLSGQLTQLRDQWRQLAGNPQTRTSLEQVCKAQNDAMRQAMQSYGCTF